MPSRPPRVCPRCRRPVPAGQRCDCQPKTDTRPGARKRGYGKAWERTRAAFLEAHPWCLMCRAEGRIERAVEVNHKTPKRNGGSDDWSNLEGLCWHHHRSVVQSRERRGAVPHGWNEDGTPKDPDHPWNREARHADR